jgi:hypothetical protein
VIIVSGTKRSGTSLWMHLLANAGVPIIGERFPMDWEQTIRDANPDGFYESQLVHGVYYRTNPHPETGDYLRPEQVHRHAVKIFIPGLVRTDLAFIDRVLVTVRPWREYAASMASLRALVRPHAAFDPDALEHSNMPAPLAWWSETFSLIRDAVTRGYPLHVTSLERLVAEPTTTLTEALTWLGLESQPGGLAERVAALADLVRPGPSPRADETEFDPAEYGLDERTVETFDALYDTMHRGDDLTREFVTKLNETDERLRPQILEHIARARLDAARRLLTSDSGPTSGNASHQHE